MLEIHFLGSGSGGNATLIRWGETRLLLDCGFSGRELARRAAHQGQDLDGLSAICITHEHRDHVCGLAGLANRPGRAVFATPKTARALYYGRRPKAERFDVVPGRPFAVGPIEVTAFSTSHDARDPVGYTFAFPDGTRLGVATDLGEPTGAVVEALSGCDLLGLESNHDPNLLRDGPYPWVLKQRIRSARGHLSNPDTADLLSRLSSPRLRHLFALHLSETNNTPAHARRALKARIEELGLDIGLTIIGQDEPLSHPPGGQLNLL